MKQYAMIIDSSKCIDCKGCVVACKVENKVPRGFSRNWIKASEPDFSDPNWLEKKPGSHYQPGGCMQCSNPTCVSACPTRATYKDESEGIVKVNEKLCIGCASCVDACPYQARFRHPTKHVVDKCDFCETRRTEGKEPACVDTCPTRARVFGDINDSNSEAAIQFKKSKKIQITNGTVDTDPNLYYFGKTEPSDWPVQLSSMTPMKIWEKGANPLVWAATGVNSLVVLAMLGRQFIDRKAKVEAENSQSVEEHHE